MTSFASCFTFQGIAHSSGSEESLAYRRTILGSDRPQPIAWRDGVLLANLMLGNGNFLGQCAMSPRRTRACSKSAASRSSATPMAPSTSSKTMRAPLWGKLCRREPPHVQRAFPAAGRHRFWARSTITGSSWSRRPAISNQAGATIRKSAPRSRARSAAGGADLGQLEQRSFRFSRDDRRSRCDVDGTL